MILDNVLDNLEIATTDLIQELVNESLYNLDLKLQLFSKKKKTFIKIDNYIVKLKKIDLMGYQKTFYDIITEDEVLYKDICLSSTLIQLLKNLLSNKPQSHNDSLIVLDIKYSAILGDMLLYKKMLKTVESPFKKSVLLAKYEGKYDASIRIKDQIRKNHK